MPGRHALVVEDENLAPAPPPPPSGWYTDPADAAQWRWWSGEEWAEHRSPRDAESGAGYAPAGTVAAAGPVEAAVEGAVEAHVDVAVEADLPEASAAAPAQAMPPTTGSDLRNRVPAQSLMEHVIRLSRETSGRSEDLADEIRSWHAGIVGERRVARILSNLGPEWTVLHSVPVGTEGADIDHLLVGPAGVYTINTKHHAGKDVWVAERALRVNNHPQHHISNAAFEARRAEKLLTQASGLTVEAAGLIVLVGVKRLTIKAAPDGGDVVVGVVRDSDLLRTMQSRRIYSDDQVRRIAAAAVRPRTWSSLPVPHVDPHEVYTEFEALALETSAARAVVSSSRPSRPVRAPRPAPGRAASSRPPTRRPSRRRRSILPELVKLVLIGVVVVGAINYLGSLGKAQPPASAELASAGAEAAAEAEAELSALTEAAGTAALRLDELSPDGIRPASLVVGKGSTLEAPDGTVLVALPSGTTAAYAPSADGLSYTLTLGGAVHGTAVTVTPEAGVLPGLPVTP
ncbi:NERD domain-containing protein [Microterricola pindariensis]|uniref:NERD domain-containing protein n=1 Tax=Microterricola pindariensis TaxID=478010 RepID=A0ABX5AXH4_9MICO|nr:NERD domain-containing protein [Microterricola pindariensis]PPL19602.1 hypothetical protein GY24_05285 [Microterricola pindariensis]